MTEDSTAPHYVAGRIEQALAEDQRTHELGIRVDVRGDVVHLRGEVAAERRRELVADVVREVAPGLSVRNEISVADVHPPGQEEKLG
jgi:osmotically-inducible protein OsmY